MGDFNKSNVFESNGEKLINVGTVKNEPNKMTGSVRILKSFGVGFIF